MPFGILALALLVAAPFGIAEAQQEIPDEARMEEGAARYEEGDFIAATAIWEELADAGVEDSHLWYNLGNAYFQQEEIGMAILSYRRALRLAPRDAEIRDNLIGEECLAIDMLRCKLSFFGASKFDPKSDRWTRITLYQGAPLFDDITSADADDWWLPVANNA